MTVISQILTRAGRDDIATMTTIASVLVIALMMGGNAGGRAAVKRAEHFRAGLTWRISGG
ncbi:MAG: hypothetical protein V8Q82_09485 [Christensenellales bacterium]